MKKLLLAGVAVAALAAGPAFAQPTPAAEPTSTRASNASPADTRSEIAPSLPVPAVAADAGPRVFLQAAQAALEDGRTGAAQEALERAEARALDRSTTPDRADRPDGAPMVRRISDARAALGRGDTEAALQTVSDALAQPTRSAANMAAPAKAPAAAPAAAPAGMISSSGETAYGFGETSARVGDDSRTYNTPGDNSFTAHPTGVIKGQDQGPGNDTGQ